MINILPAKLQENPCNMTLKRPPRALLHNINIAYANIKKTEIAIHEWSFSSFNVRVISYLCVFDVPNKLIRPSISLSNNALCE